MLPFNQKIFAYVMACLIAVINSALEAEDDWTNLPNVMWRVNVASQLPPFCKPLHHSPITRQRPYISFQKEGGYLTVA